MVKRTQWGYAVARAMQDFMRERGITQEHVAERLDRSQGYISQRTNGREAMTVDIVGAVAELAHLTPDALIFELSQRASRSLAAQPSPAEGTETVQQPLPDLN
jgi:transcriptional regulator with XRE-family HTH domain